MDELLKYLGFRAFIRLEFPISKEEFYWRFGRMVNEDAFITFVSESEEEAARQNKYVGQVNLDSFKIKNTEGLRRWRIFTPDILGAIKSAKGGVIVEITVDGFPLEAKFLLVIFVLALYLFYSSPEIMENQDINFTVNSFLIPLLILFVFLLQIKGDVVNETLNIEREINYALSKKM